MAANLVVEDGGGNPLSNSFASVAEFKTHMSDRGITDFLTKSDDQISYALIGATDYIEAMYKMRWKGMKKSKNQALSWPRVGVVVDEQGSAYWLPGWGSSMTGFNIDSNEIPALLKRANIDLAGKILNGESPLADPQPGAGNLASVSVAGAITVSYNSQFDPNKRYRWVEALLLPYLNSSGPSFEIVRG